ncbi:hypothetical protein BC831DRAFT_446784 [Entophlyctis helioformis]|nr:hypothetical protein BC831DRAFT_446784 [Entophlyctis helioformis]
MISASLPGPGTDAAAGSAPCDEAAAAAKSKPLAAASDPPAPAEPGSAPPQTTSTTTSTTNSTTNSTTTSKTDVDVGRSATDPSRSQALLQEFELGRFSDISVVCFGRTFKLHRIMLLQSPFFRSLLLASPLSTIIVLRTDTDPRITPQGLAIVLNDLYCIHSPRSSAYHGKTSASALASASSAPPPMRLTLDNAMSVLAAAAFLELEDLGATCTEAVASMMAMPSAVARIAWQLDDFDPASACPPASYGPQHGYVGLLKRYHGQMSTLCLARMCRIVSLFALHGHGTDSLHATDSAAQGAAVAAEPASADRDGGAVADDMGSGSSQDAANEVPPSSPMPLLDFLTQLPLTWLKRLIECDWLCVRFEFDRYLIAKEVLRVCRARAETGTSGTEAGNGAATLRLNSTWQSIRRGNMDDAMIEAVPAADNPKAGAADTPDPPPASPASTRTTMAGLFTSIFDGLLTSKKRRLDEPQSASKTAQDAPPPQEIGSADEGANSGTSSHTSAVVLHEGDPPMDHLRGRLIKNAKGRRLTPPTNLAKPSWTASHLASANDDLMRQIFEQCIVYTYMTFPQLDIVKRDGLVPTSIVLESHWLQAELSNGMLPTPASFPFAVATRAVLDRGRMSASSGSIDSATAAADTEHGEQAAQEPASSLPSFRFGARFDNVSEQVAAYDHLATVGDYGDTDIDDDGDLRPLVMYSTPVVCAGIQYRLVLSYDPPAPGSGPAAGAPLARDGADQDSVDTLVSGGPTAESPRVGRAHTATDITNVGMPASSSSDLQQRLPGLRALLQRQKPGTTSAAAGSANTSTGTTAAPQPPISYKIYAFDHREGGLFVGPLGRPAGAAISDQIREFEPITVCDKVGNGYARAIDATLMVTHRRRQAHRDAHGDPLFDSVWLLAVVEFG